MPSDLFQIYLSSSFKEGFFSVKDSYIMQYHVVSCHVMSWYQEKKEKKEKRTRTGTDKMSRIHATIPWSP